MQIKDQFGATPIDLDPLLEELFRFGPFPVRQSAIKRCNRRTTHKGKESKKNPNSALEKIGNRDRRQGKETFPSCPAVGP
jgi:hypothetical protein